MKTNIPKSEISNEQLSRMDDVGTVFYWKNRVFRGITTKGENIIKEMFNSGMIDELTKKNFIPRTWISEYSLDGFQMVIEHEKIPFVTFPYQWSFSMFKDAALSVFKLNKLINKYGFQTKDCHGYNILFKGSKPIFVDIGSFIKVDKNIKRLISYDEFTSFYYYPLKIWGKNNSPLANLIISSNISSPFRLNFDNYLMYKINFFTLNKKILKLIKKIFIFLTLIKSADNERISKKLPKKIGKLFIYLDNKKLIPFRFTIDKIIKKTEKIMPPRNIETRWGNYHNKLFDKKNNPISNHRFNRVISIIKNLNVKSVVELGGNQGALSNLIERKTSINRIICTDYDHNAVETMYNRFKKTGSSITPAMLNFVNPYYNLLETPPVIRFKSDVVIALAITHHLLLTQNIKIDFLIKTLSGYTNKYILVEFMPLGLWSRYSSITPIFPNWYNEKAFKKAFEKYFDIQTREKLAENRILYVGIKK